MKVKQVSVFLENKPGHILSVCETLKNADIDILTLTLAETSEFGVLHLIVQNPEKTSQILSNAGYTVKTGEVIALEVEDHPGGLAKILSILAQHNVNIAYLYAFTHAANKKEILVFSFDDPDVAITVLDAAGVFMFGQQELYELQIS